MNNKKTSTILSTIIEHKKREVEERKKSVDINKLKQYPYYNRKTYSLKRRFQDIKQLGIIAEIKEKSPSKGIINPDFDVLEIAKGYQKSNVAGISILTDNEFFGGNLEYISFVRDEIQIPILQKDFIIDPYQIYEAKAIGADVILLIASCLDIVQCQNLAKIACSLKLDVLLEVHNLDEINNYISENMSLIGVNNRNLKTFETAIQNATNLYPKIPSHHIRIAESGIHNPEALLELKKIGYNGFLIGEKFMKEKKPHFACEDFSNYCIKILKNK